MPGVFECVANVSEGRSAEVVGALADACGGELLDVHVGPDHHRSVFTLGGPLDGVEGAVTRLARACLAHVDIRRHDGVHPRLGALDVVPFVALDRGEAPQAATAARRFAGWLGTGLGVPAFLYDDADERHRSLPELRAEAFRGRPPDTGPAEPHPTMGATAVGARPPLVAVNCLLATGDADVARTVAADVRERDGGLRGVRALGLWLESRRRSQVSMNLVDLDATGIEAACRAVAAGADRRGVSVEAVELVGLVPRTELERCTEGFRAWAGIDDDRTVEARLERRGPG